MKVWCMGPQSTGPQSPILHGLDMDSGLWKDSGLPMSGQGTFNVRKPVDRLLPSFA